MENDSNTNNTINEPPSKSEQETLIIESILSLNEDAP